MEYKTELCVVCFVVIAGMLCEASACVTILQQFFTVYLSCVFKHYTALALTVETADTSSNNYQRIPGSHGKMKQNPIFPKVLFTKRTFFANQSRTEAILYTKGLRIDCIV